MAFNWSNSKKVLFFFLTQEWHFFMVRNSCVIYFLLIFFIKALHDYRFLDILKEAQRSDFDTDSAKISGFWLVYILFDIYYDWMTLDKVFWNAIAPTPFLTKGWFISTVWQIRCWYHCLLFFHMSFIMIMNLKSYREYMVTSWAE